MTILIILGLVAVAFGVGYYLIKSGKVEDTNGNLIPDVVEEKTAEILEEVKEKVEEVKKEVKKRAPRKTTTSKPAAKKTTTKKPVAPKTVVVEKKKRGPRK
jgi:topoisomerase IA-like protein